MAADHATNCSYKNCSFCIINYFEKDKKTYKLVVLLYILQNTKFIILVWVFVDDDDGDNEMIM